MAAVLTLEQTKQIRINIHKRNNNKTQYNNTKDTVQTIPNTVNKLYCTSRTKYYVSIRINTNQLMLFTEILFTWQVCSHPQTRSTGKLRRISSVKQVVSIATSELQGVKCLSNLVLTLINVLQPGIKLKLVQGLRVHIVQNLKYWGLNFSEERLKILNLIYCRSAETLEYGL